MTKNINESVEMNMKKTAKIVCSLFMAIALLISGIAYSPASTQAAVKLSKKSITVKVGKKYKLKLKGTKKAPKWSSANKKIAKVNKKGVVKGIKAGKTKVFAKLGKKKYTCKVKVVKASAATPAGPADANQGQQPGTATTAPVNGNATKAPDQGSVTNPPVMTDQPVVTEAPSEETPTPTRTTRPTRTPSPSPEPSPEPLVLKDWNNDYATAAYYKQLTALAPETAGKEIIIAAQEGNKVYALSSDGSAVTKTDITDSLFKDGVHVRANAAYEAYSWDVKYNFQLTSARGYGFENMANGVYVGIVSSKLGVSKNPIGEGYDTTRSFTWADDLSNAYASSALLGYTGGAFASVSSSNNIMMFEKVETKKSTWTKVDVVKPNREYLMVNSTTAGAAKIFTMNGTSNSSIGTKDVTIASSGGKLTINYTGDYNDAAVLHTYGIGDNYFWLDTWYCPDTRQTLTLGTDSTNRPYISSEHADNIYYFRFSYSNNTLTAYNSYTGTETRTLSFSGTNISSGSGTVYFFERDR